MKGARPYRSVAKGGENSKIMRKITKGFTLIELLVVIGIIGILAAIVLVAVNPGRQFAQARNTQRRSDMLAITSAVYQFASEHDGNLPATAYVAGVGDFPICANSAGTDATEIGSAAFALATAGARDAVGDGAADAELTVPTYLTEVPSDPSTGDYATATGTDYFICVMGAGTTTPGRVYAAATDELGAAGNTDINVLR